MQFRIKIKKNENDPSVDLEIASSLRRDLWAHSPIEIDVDDPKVATKRNANRVAYFEFSTEYPDEVDRVVREYGYANFVDVERPGEVSAI
jgi:hypothetical protein